MPKAILASVFAIGLMVFSTPVFASEEGSEEKFNVSEVILHHVMDDHVWHFADGLVLPLPVIVYSAEKGLDIFSSGNFFNEHHQPVDYNGYKLEHNHITLAESGKAVLDLSITKNVAMLFINVALILFVLIKVSSAYKRNKGKAPSGLQSFI